jgi:phosphoesterase RecJ-like protein
MDIITVLTTANSPLFVTHRQADKDSLGSAIGLRALLGRGAVCVPDGVRQDARPLVSTTDTALLREPDLEEFDQVVVVDAPSSDRIAPLDPPSPVLIDHHRPDDLAERATAKRVDTEAVATAELVTEIAIEAGWNIIPEAALPLAVGLLDDSGSLETITPRAASVLGTLFGALGDRAPMLAELLHTDTADGVENARALGVLRSRGYRAGDLTLGFTRVGGQESAAANAMRANGIDLAVVTSDQGNELRVTTRASDTFTDVMSLGEELLPALAMTFGGDGGGHDSAGTAHLEAADGEDVESFVLQHLERELGMTFGEI